ncbi:serine hydrolase domain-containing protein [Sphingosinithalassobacter sp. CS137]|uniref:serine hydrolase domain-containing protein n=1 Tax=Sphingosinithalassobacter sp. CS137 TaxID=2762748 RepID=UPI00165E2D1F|nr:serine hydrolase domain-containing protein [Sphingosinithalassobacter sp. CS137]
MKLVLALALAATCLTTIPAAAQQAAEADTAAATRSGVAFTQPKDWTAQVRGPATLLTAPEGTLTIAVVDVGSAANAQAAAAQAWAMYNPEANRTVRVVTAGNPGGGWDERVGISYETSPSERATVSASALRKGDDWTVVITDGSEAVASMRMAATSLIAQSLRPAGYREESFAGKTAHRLTPDRIQAMRDFVAQSAEALEVPGVGYALIDNGSVVYQGGYGVRALGSTEPVDEHTKFMIASNTKGMATLLLSVLADEDKLRWEQPVTDLYPDFRLGSDATTESTLVRHLVCACTGLPRKDFAFILDDPGAPAMETFVGLAETEPTSDFGELFQYNNLMASAAGYLGGMLAYPEMEVGAAFDRAMQDRIFGPLGMPDTTFSFEEGESGNWARPHGYDLDGRMVLMSNGFNHLITPHRPAGGAWSTAADFARYAQLELGKGLTPEGERLVSEENILERRRRGVPLGENAWYGMGLMERIVSGVSVITHGGTLQGFHSNFYAIPEAGIGAVILTNSDSGASMLGPFLRRLLEIAYDGEPEAAAEVAAAAGRLKAQAQARRERLTFPPDTEVLAGLATTYRDPEVGSIEFTEKDGVPWMKAGFVEGPVATRQNADGTVSVVSAGPGIISVDALVGALPDGTRTLTVRESQHEYVYTEVP